MIHDYAILHHLFPFPAALWTLYIVVYHFMVLNIYDAAYL